MLRDASGFPFSVVGLDIQDEMGRHEVGHIDNSMKVPLNNGYGCRFEGSFSINKVRTFLLLPHKGEADDGALAS